MKFEEYVADAHDRFSGTISNPSFSGNYVKHLLADWKAEREKLIEALIGLLDGLDANADERCGLFQDEWDKRITQARAILAEIEGKEK